MSNNKNDDYEFLFKYIMVGYTSTGKTQILLQFSEHKFEQAHDATVGIDFLIHDIEFKENQSHTTQINTKIKLQIFDLAGSAEYKSITRSYYRNATAIFLVYDVTRRHTFEDLDLLVQEIHKECYDNVCVILIGNKNDLEHRRQITTKQGEKYASKYGYMFFETSAKTGANIEKIFNEATKKIFESIPKDLPSNSLEMVRYENFFQDRNIFRGNTTSRNKLNIPNHNKIFLSGHQNKLIDNSAKRYAWCCY